jgi:hypothetical protein
MRLCYIRFGKIPSNNKSKIYRGDALIGEENGVSVWECLEYNGTYRLLVPNPCNANAMADIDSDLLKSHYYLPKPVFEVEGTVVGIGSDGEPLLGNITMIKKLADDIEQIFPHERVP